MDRGQRISAAVAVGLLLWSGSALGQGKSTCTAQGKVQTAQKVVGQVVKVDAGLDKLTVRENDGTVHEFQASKEALREFKAGDRIEATLREAPKCP
jgi:hypothetical protein